MMQRHYDLGKWGPLRDGIDGEYGSDTKRAVKDFEAACGLPADGIADAACIEAIKRAAGVGLGKVRVTGGTVNIRSAANTDNTPLGTVKKGTLLDRTGNDTEHWYGVMWNGRAAYISAKYAEVIQ